MYYAVIIRALTDGYFVAATQILERLDGVIRHVRHDFRAPVKVAQRVTGESVQKLFGQRHRQRFPAAHPQLQARQDSLFVVLKQARFVFKSTAAFIVRFGFPRRFAYRDSILTRGTVFCRSVAALCSRISYLVSGAVDKHLTDRDNSLRFECLTQIYRTSFTDIFRRSWFLLR